MAAAAAEVATAAQARPSQPSASAQPSPVPLQTQLPAGMPAVVRVLEELRLERYATRLEEEGYDDLEYLLTLDEAGLDAVARSVEMKAGHAHKFAALFPAACASSTSAL